jgi:hypothetical protein
LLSIPSAEQHWRLQLHRWRAVLSSGLRRHSLRSGAVRTYRATFEPTEALHERFAVVYDLRRGPGAVDYPVLLSHSVHTALQDRVLADLGVTRCQARVLLHHIHLPSGAAALASPGRQHLECSLLRVVRLSPRQALAILQTRVHAADGAVVAVVEDGHVLDQLAPADTLQADEDDRLRQTVSRTQRRQAEIARDEPGVQTRQLYIASNARRLFRRVAGPGRNLLLPKAQLTGHRPGGAPVDEAHLRHLVARELAEWCLVQRSFQFTALRQVHQRETLCLVVRQHAFEVVDTTGGLVAFGKAR